MNEEFTNVLTNLIPVFLLLVFIMSFAYAVFRRKPKTKDNPVKAVGLMMLVLSILIVTVPIINFVEKEKTPEWFFAVVFLMLSMSVIYPAFKQMEKRITALEEKLKDHASRNE